MLTLAQVLGPSDRMRFELCLPQGSAQCWPVGGCCPPLCSAKRKPAMVRHKPLEIMGSRAQRCRGCIPAESTISNVSSCTNWQRWLEQQRCHNVNAMVGGRWNVTFSGSMLSRILLQPCGLYLLKLLCKKTRLLKFQWNDNYTKLLKPITMLLGN